MHSLDRAARLAIAVIGAVFAGAAAAEPSADAACPGFVAARPLLVQPAALAKDEVGLTFIGHATFLIESPGGIRVATDYNDYVRPQAAPDVATMNKAHSTHHSFRPDPAIRHVLRGWNPSGGAARHDVQVGDVRLRNIPTNIRDWSGGGTDFEGNSMFVIETADLCIAHLGHLHHTLEPAHLKKLGRIDVLLVPVDGSYTLDVEGMLEVIEKINAPLMVPMHYFGPGTLNRFLSRVESRYPVERSASATITLSRATLPKAPKILVLPVDR